jgi:FixJ family two-component response regulator
MPTEPTVFVVDDDPGVLKSLCWLIQSAQLPVKTFESAERFLESYDRSWAGCLLLDVRMRGMSGLELQAELTAHGTHLPTIVMTGYGDVPTCARAFKGGVFDFLEKPADDALLMNRITAAMELSAHDRERCADAGELTTRLERLTLRQQEVLDLLITGTPLKLVATRLGVSVQTAAKHRAQVHFKLQVQSDAELVRLMLSQQGPRQP